MPLVARCSASNISILRLSALVYRERRWALFVLYVMAWIVLDAHGAVSGNQRNAVVASYSGRCADNAPVAARDDTCLQREWSNHYCCRAGHPADHLARADVGSNTADASRQAQALRIVEPAFRYQLLRTSVTPPADTAGASPMLWPRTAPRTQLEHKARDAGCVDVPHVVAGSMYKCTVATGASAYFSVPDPAMPPIISDEAARPSRASASKGGGGGLLLILLLAALTRRSATGGWLFVYVASLIGSVLVSVVLCMSSGITDIDGSWYSIALDIGYATGLAAAAVTLFLLYRWTNTRQRRPDAHLYALHWHRTAQRALFALSMCELIVGHIEQDEYGTVFGIIHSVLWGIWAAYWQWSTRVKLVFVERNWDDEELLRRKGRSRVATFVERTLDQVGVPGALDQGGRLLNRMLGGERRRAAPENGRSPTARTLTPRYCHRCGAALSTVDAQFCSSCGVAVVRHLK